MYQTKVNADKLAAVDALKALFGAAGDYVFTDYRGLTVEAITELRERLREQAVEYRVVKNTFARVALQQMQKPDVSHLLTGPTAVALAKHDAAPALKLLLEFGEDHPVEVKGALVGDRVFDAAQAAALSKLPGREALVAQLMSVMQAPLQNLVFAANGIPTKLVRVLRAVADKKGA